MILYSADLHTGLLGIEKLRPYMQGLAFTRTKSLTLVRTTSSVATWGEVGAVSLVLANAFARPNLNI